VIIDFLRVVRNTPKLKKMAKYKYFFFLVIMNRPNDKIVPIFIDAPNAPTSLNAPGIHLREVPKIKPSVIGIIDRMKINSIKRSKILITTPSVVSILLEIKKTMTNKKVKSIPRK
jgi:hypothetical protein